MGDGITARALGLDYDGEGSRWAQKTIFFSLVLLPIGYLLSMAWAWRHRGVIRAKSGVSGMFSLWFPLLTTAGAAWVILWLVPSLVGVPLGTLKLFQPDVGLAMVATAVSGALWALFRLAVAYTVAPTRPDRQPLPVRSVGERSSDSPPPSRADSHRPPPQTVGSPHGNTRSHA